MRAGDARATAPRHSATRDPEVIHDDTDHDRRPTAIAQLRTAVRGRVITPADADYDALRTITVGGFDPHPAAIVRVADADDVAAVVRIATELGLDLAVRSGGHSGAGHSSIDGASSSTSAISTRSRSTSPDGPPGRAAG